MGGGGGKFAHYKQKSKCGNTGAEERWRGPAQWAGRAGVGEGFLEGASEAGVRPAERKGVDKDREPQTLPDPNNSRPPSVGAPSDWWKRSVALPRQDSGKARLGDRGTVGCLVTVASPVPHTLLHNRHSTNIC